MGFDFSEHGLPMQPGETSWASWKCDGGPHQDDTLIGETKHDKTKCSAVILSYAGCEGSADLPVTINIPNDERANLPG